MVLARPRHLLAAVAGGLALAGELFTCCAGEAALGPVGERGELLVRGCEENDGDIERDGCQGVVGSGIQRVSYAHFGLGQRNYENELLEVVTPSDQDLRELCAQLAKGSPERFERPASFAEKFDGKIVLMAEQEKWSAIEEKGCDNYSQLFSDSNVYYFWRVNLFACQAFPNSIYVQADEDSYEVGFWVYVHDQILFAWRGTWESNSWYDVYANDLPIKTCTKYSGYSRRPGDTSRIHAALGASNITLWASIATMENPYHEILSHPATTVFFNGVCGLLYLGISFKAFHSLAVIKRQKGSVPFINKIALALNAGQMFVVSIFLLINGYSTGGAFGSQIDNVVRFLFVCSSLWTSFLIMLTWQRVLSLGQSRWFTRERVNKLTFVTGLVALTVEGALIILMSFFFNLWMLGAFLVVAIGIIFIGFHLFLLMQTLKIYRFDRKAQETGGGGLLANVHN